MKRRMPRVDVVRTGGIPAGMIRAALFFAALLLAAMLLAPRAAAADAPVGVKVPAHQRFVLPNGLTIVLMPKKDVPMIAFSASINAAWTRGSVVLPIKSAICSASSATAPVASSTSTAVEAVPKPPSSSATVSTTSTVPACAHTWLWRTTPVAPPNASENVSKLASCSCTPSPQSMVAVCVSGRPASVNVAALGQMTFVVFFAGPPLLGFVAQQFGIRFSYWTVVPLIVAALLAIKALSPAPSAMLSEPEPATPHG